MKRLIFVLFLIVPLMLSAQQNYFTKQIFTSGNDTLQDIAAPDTVFYRLGASGAGWADWIQLSTTITAANKTDEKTISFSLADDSNWHWAETIQIKLRSDPDSLVSNTATIGGFRGAITLFVKVDTVENGASDYGLITDSKLGGN